MTEPLRSAGWFTGDEIRACARALVKAGGYNGFSYADIADVVGIRKPQIHPRFPTKAELVRTLVSRYREEAVTDIASLEAQTSDPLELLRSYMGHWAACIRDGSAPFCACAVLARELPVLPPEVALEVRAHFRTISAWLASVLKRGQAEGKLALTDPPEIEAESVMATVHGAMLSARAFDDPEIFAVVASRLIERFDHQQQRSCSSR